VKNIFIQGKGTIRLTFNPGLALTGFRTFRLVPSIVTLCLTLLSVDPYGAEKRNPNLAFSC